MAHINIGIHPKITRYCFKRPSHSVITQLERFCGRVELVNTYSARYSWHVRVDLYGFRDLRNLFMIDILLQDVRAYS
jgi:TRAP-type mannitol/chloroaromatic compound transport system permease small subunit